MGDIVSCFSEILDYFDSVISTNRLSSDFSSELDDQRENLEDLQNLLNEYESNMKDFTFSDEVENQWSLKEIMEIHTFITLMEWHVSEISDLKDKFMAIWAQKIEQENGE